MKKLLEKASSIDVITVVFVLLGLRNTIIGTESVGAALALFAVAALLGVSRYISYKRGPDVNEEVKKQLDDIKSYVTSISMKHGLKKEPLEAPKAGQRWF